MSFGWLQSYIGNSWYILVIAWTCIWFRIPFNRRCIWNWHFCKTLPAIYIWLHYECFSKRINGTELLPLRLTQLTKCNGKWLFVLLSHLYTNALPILKLFREIRLVDAFFMFYIWWHWLTQFSLWSMAWLFFKWPCVSIVIPLSHCVAFLLQCRISIFYLLLLWFLLAH